MAKNSLNQAPERPKFPDADLDRYPRTLATGGPNAKTIEFVTSTSSRIIAEIGVYRGDTACQLAKFLDNRGELHLFDFQHRIEEVIFRLHRLGYFNVIGHGNSYKILDSYTWSLMRVLEQHSEPFLDYVFIDGAHSWAHDALAFLLVDRLLKPGGYVDFDDYAWTMKQSPSLRPEVFPLTAELYTSEQISTPQVGLVLNLLLRRDPRYTEVVNNKIFQKLRATSL